MHANKQLVNIREYKAVYVYFKGRIISFWTILSANIVSKMSEMVGFIWKDI